MGSGHPALTSSTGSKLSLGMVGDSTKHLSLLAPMNSLKLISPSSLQAAFRLKSNRVQGLKMGCFGKSGNM